MQSIYEIHKNKSEKELIEMIENKDNYTPECVEIILEILDSRDIDQKEKSAFIKQINQEKARKNLLNQNLSKAETVMHKSHFLDKKHIRSIYIKEMKKIIKDQEGFQFDVWSYSIGAY